MLIKHQSFDVTQKGAPPKRKRGEKLYDAKKYPYLKYILIPGIIGFMLLCILVNVDFSGGHKTQQKNGNLNAQIKNNGSLSENGTNFQEKAVNISGYEEDKKLKSRSLVNPFVTQRYSDVMQMLPTKSEQPTEQTHQGIDEITTSAAKVISVQFKDQRLNMERTIKSAYVNSVPQSVTLKKYTLGTDDSESESLENSETGSDEHEMPFKESVLETVPYSGKLVNINSVKKSLVQVVDKAGKSRLSNKTKNSRLDFILDPGNHTENNSSKIKWPCVSNATAHKVGNFPVDFEPQRSQNSSKIRLPCITNATADKAGNFLVDFKPQNAQLKFKPAIKKHFETQTDMSKVANLPSGITNYVKDTSTNLNMSKFPNMIIHKHDKKSYSTTTIGNATLKLPTTVNVGNSKIENFNASLKKVDDFAAEIQQNSVHQRVGNTGSKLKITEQYLEDVKHIPNLQNETPPKNMGQILPEDNSLMKTNNHDVNNPALHNRVRRELPNVAELVSTNKATNAIKCTKSIETCSLKCDTGSVSYVDEDLEDLQIQCRYKYLSFELKNCVFLDGVMKTNFLNGFYNLEEMQVINCNLATFQNDVFKGRGAVHLQTLRFINNSISSLTDTTFAGLKELKHFEFSQVIQTDKGIETNFLTPLAPTLTNVKIMQTLDNNAVVDPAAWLQGPDFVNLYILDLADNNFQDVLRPGTFKALTALGVLNLQSCSLNTIDMKPFESVLDTLSQLYLDNNNLKVLDPLFLDQMVHGKITLTAGGNAWQCDCENSIMIDYMKASEHFGEFLNTQDFVCNEPEELRGTNMVDVVLKCDDATSTTEETTTTNTTTIASTVTTTTTETSDDNSTTTSEITQNSTTPTTTPLSTITKFTTVPSQPTSSITELPTTTPNDSVTQIPCNCNNSESSDIDVIDLKPRTAALTFHTLNSTSISVISSRVSFNYRIIYFHNYLQYSTVKSASAYEWIINNLHISQAYVFCLVYENTRTVSPFDCWPHSMGKSESDDWLLISDKGWFVGVMLIVVVLFCIIGGAGVYFVLYQRPTWLSTANKRLLRVHPTSHKVVLLPKRISAIRRDSSTSNKSNEQDTSARASYLRPKPRCDAQANTISLVYDSLQKPPTECAPSPPDETDGHSYTTPCYSPREDTTPLDRVSGGLRWSFSDEENKYGYNTIDHYEEVKF